MVIILLATEKGRPQKNNNNIIINDISVEQLSTKNDKFDNSIVYLKLTDPKSKLKQVFDTQTNDKDIKLSCIWTTDTQDIILKVKEKWINTSTDDLQPLTNYTVSADFTAYSLDTDNGNMKGYYIKIAKIKKKKMDSMLGRQW